VNAQVIKTLLGLALTGVFLVALFLHKTEEVLLPVSNPVLESNKVLFPTTATVTPQFATTTTPLYDVVKVIDGDTLRVHKDGDETVDPRRPMECFGKEASGKAKQILSGTRIHIEMDSSQGVLDKYGRTLAYVFLEDGTNFNEYMIREGYAYEYTYHLPYKYQLQFKEAERKARVLGKGLWADGACGMKNVSALIAPAYSATTSGKNYVCNKNTYNCSNFSTQHEAQAVFEACGGSANDIHKLDSDNDGIVCEGLP
jgi:micrococcal nuclease